MRLEKGRFSVKKISPLAVILLCALASMAAVPSLFTRSFADTANVIQSGQTIHCSSTATLTLGSDVTAGDVLIVGIDFGAAESGPTYSAHLTDSQSNSFAEQVLHERTSTLSPPDGGGEYESGIYTAVAKANSSDTFTLTAQYESEDTDTCYSIQVVEASDIYATPISTGIGSGNEGNCCGLNSSLTFNTIDFATALTDDTGEGTWSCTNSNFTCLTASQTEFFGGNGNGEYALIDGNQSTSQMNMTLTTAKDVFVETAAIFEQVIPPVIVYDVGSSNGACNVASLTNSLTTNNASEVIVGLVSWSNTSAFTINSGWNFRQSEYIDPGGSGNVQYGENLTEYWMDAPTPGTYSLTVTENPSNTEACIGIIEFSVIGVNTTAPFDPSFTLPSVTTDTTGLPNGTVVATTNPNNMIIGLEGDQQSSNQIAGSGFTLAQTNSNGEDVSAEYLVVNQTQSDLAVPFAQSLTYPWIQFTDALTHGDGTGAPIPPGPTTTTANNAGCCQVFNPTTYTSSNFLTSTSTVTSSTTTKTTITFTREYPYIDDIVTNVPPNKPLLAGYNFVVDNSGAGNQTQLLQITLKYPNSKIQVIYPASELPIMVAAASKANLPFNLSISSPGLPTKS